MIGKTSDAGKKVYSASMYIPNMALGLTGEVIVSAKQLVFALNEVKFELCLLSYLKHFTFLPSAQMCFRIGNIFQLQTQHGNFQQIYSG